MKYKKMLQDIDDLVQTDFAFEMDARRGKYSQKEAKEMAELIGDIYLISHCIHCKICGKKYE